MCDIPKRVLFLHIMWHKCVLEPGACASIPNKASIVPRKHYTVSLSDYPRYCSAEPSSRESMALVRVTVLLPNTPSLNISCFAAIHSVIEKVVYLVP